MSNSIVEIHNLNFSYPGQKELLRDLNCNVRLGDIIFLSGANGSGKTTFIRLVLGLITPQSGVIHLDKRMTFSFQSADRSGFYENLTGLENLQLWSALKKIPEQKFQAKIIQWSALPVFQKSLQVSFQQCSSGMKGILALFLALELNADGPHVACLDEPLANLDQEAVSFLLEVLARKNENCTVIFSGHHIPAELKNICDHCFNLAGGKLVSNP